jgi:aquaporin Z
MISYITEFIGTFIFLSVILQAVRKNSSMSAFVPIAIGLALVAAIQFGGSISGGHYNPAVSVMFFLNKSLPSKDLIPYIVAQILGGIAAKYFYDNANRN